MTRTLLSDRGLEAQLDLQRRSIVEGGFLGGKQGRERYETITQILETLMSPSSSARDKEKCRALGRKILEIPLPP